MDTSTNVQPASASPTPSKQKLTGIITLIVALIVLAGVYILWSAYRTPGNDQGEITKENVEVSAVEVKAGAASPLPEGFPASIPVDRQNVTSGYKSVYKDHGVTQYTVSYTSNRSRDLLWNEYSNYFRANGYILDASISRMNEGIITGKKVGGEINAVIVTADSKSYVTVNYIERQN